MYKVNSINQKHKESVTNHKHHKNVDRLLDTLYSGDKVSRKIVHSCTKSIIKEVDVAHTYVK